MEPQDYSRNIIQICGPGRYIPITFLLYSWGSLFGVSIVLPLSKSTLAHLQHFPLPEAQTKMPDRSMPGHLPQVKYWPKNRKICPDGYYFTYLLVLGEAVDITLWFLCIVYLAL